MREVLCVFDTVLTVFCSGDFDTVDERCGWALHGCCCEVPCTHLQVFTLCVYVSVVSVCVCE